MDESERAPQSLPHSLALIVAEFCREIRASWLHLKGKSAELYISSRRGMHQSFVQFVEIHLTDIALAYQLANPECRQRVQNLLFDDGLAYSPELGILNRSKNSLFSMLEKIRAEITYWRPRRDLNPCYRRERAVS